MEEASQQGQRDRITSTSTSPLPATGGGRPIEQSSFTEMTLPPKEERLVAATPSAGAVMTVPSPDIPDHLESSYLSGGFVYPQQQTYFYGGFENNSGTWDDYSRYVNANGLQVVPPGIYNDNSLLYHSGYGLDTQMAYGQFSPMASPLSPIMVDGQLYSPHHVPMSPSYFPQPASPGLPNVTSSHQISQNDMVAAGSTGQDVMGDNGLFGPGSGYVVQFGSFGGGTDALGNRSNSETASYMSPLAPSNVYPQPMGILGPYDHNAGQMNQQMPSHGFGLVTSPVARNYPQGGSYQNSNYNAASMSRWNNRSQLSFDKGGRRDRDRESIYIPIAPQGVPNDRNRGPRASKPRGKSSTEESSSSGTSRNVPVSGADLPHNQPDFVTDYENAKFFIIKSFSEDNVHKSIKYNVWASTPLGNRKLDAAYSDSKDMKSPCPIFLFFSVNASGQFCGVAEMIGPVDFENDADYWQQDRWSGQFPVRWHILKDVPNSRFRHILLQNNENKPVTHSRDSQEVNLEQGIEMLKIFKDYDAETTILDDFIFYDEREKALQERKARQQVASVKNGSVPDSSRINELSESFAESLQLEAGKEAGKEAPKAE